MKTQSTLGWIVALITIVFAANNVMGFTFSSPVAEEGGSHRRNRPRLQQLTDTRSTTPVVQHPFWHSCCTSIRIVVISLYQWSRTGTGYIQHIEPRRDRTFVHFLSISSCCHSFLILEIATSAHLWHTACRTIPCECRLAVSTLLAVSCHFYPFGRRLRSDLAALCEIFQKPTSFPIFKTPGVAFRSEIRPPKQPVSEEMCRNREFLSFCTGLGHP